jgi:hypothetical protein
MTRLELAWAVLGVPAVLVVLWVIDRSAGLT